MFNKKRIAFLERELEFEKKQNEKLLNVIRTDMFALRNELSKINDRFKGSTLLINKEMLQQLANGTYNPEHHTPPGA